jgi:hypothetical protein
VSSRRPACAGAPDREVGGKIGKVNAVGAYLGVRVFSAVVGEPAVAKAYRLPR